MRPALLTLLALTACQGPIPTPSQAQSPSATPEPVTASPAAALLPEPGTPYDGADLLAAMRASRRPGGVPDEIERLDLADAVADQLWTYAGEPWREIVAGGSCGPEICTLELAGQPDGALGDDLYVFEVVPASGAVTLLSADLRGLPAELLPSLDEQARAAGDRPSLDGLVLLSASWLPPPNAGIFALHYRSGGEEGSPSVDLFLDAATGELVDDPR